MVQAEIDNVVAKVPPTWKNTFNPTVWRPAESHPERAQIAKTCGYLYYVWLGKVYITDPSQPLDTGLIAGELDRRAVFIPVADSDKLAHVFNILRSTYRETNGDMLAEWRTGVNTHPGTGIKTPTGTTMTIKFKGGAVDTELPL